VSKERSYCLDDGGIRVRFPAGARKFSLFQNFRTRSGATQPLLKLWVPAGLYPRTKQLWREVDPSPQPRMEVNNFISPHACMACRVTTFLPLFRYQHRCTFGYIQHILRNSQFVTYAHNVLVAEAIFRFNTYETCCLCLHKPINYV